ncbi:type II secretion system secretin GspD [Marinimicrobium alkaliphilum]|uniref:type II secretion system secretin GspD n=1 Tax=Marinimicrobium alkaliphilum TaxID=2202654 RepID=UPI000DB93182|nr:type II secretion system secretin GspD [Marinimicrobium alkaliphilum]
MKACIKRLPVLLGALLLSATAFAEPWTVNFRDSDIQEVILFVADATGKTIVIDPKVRGQVKVVSAEPVSTEELYALFLSVLDVHGFTAVESGNLVRVVPNRDARSLPVPSTQEGRDGDDTYITQVVQLQHTSAAKVLPTLRPLVPQHGHLSAYDPSNAIIITDTRSNIRRILNILERIDTEKAADTDVLDLRYAAAADVVNLLNQIQRRDADGSTAQPQLTLVPDERTNSILVHGSDMQRSRIRALVERVDRPQAADSNVRVIYLRYAKAEQVAQVLSGVVQDLAQVNGDNAKASVQADVDTNAILITAGPDIMETLLVVIDSLDIRRAQVLVEAIIVEIEDTGGRELGFQWMYRDNDYGFGASTDGDGTLAGIGGSALGTLSGSQDQRDAALLGLAQGLSQAGGQTFGVGRLGERTDFLGILRMLQESSATNILSTPNLLTTDNHTASISVGQNVPFVTGSFSGFGGGGGSSPQNPFQTIERRDVGILLEVTPHINEGDSVVLEIAQEVSSLSSISSQTGPITNQRNINTQILAEDGETVVLGGLIQDDVQTSEQRVPILGSIPVLGHLFRSQSSTVRKTNLLVFIRATVVRDERMLTGATAEKYRVIRDQQIERRRSTPGIMVNRRDMPVLPEWEEFLREAPAQMEEAVEELEQESDD